jgi:hypothetical protein
MRSALLLLALACCAKSEDKPVGTVVASRVLQDATFDLPQGWTSTYGQDDAWQFTSPTGTKVRFERTDERYIASPDAFMEHVAPKNQLVTIEQREHSGKGFAITLARFANEKDEHPQRSTYVVRPLGKAWYACHADGLDEEARRNEVIELCRSLRI